LSQALWEKLAGTSLHRFSYTKLRHRSDEYVKKHSLFVEGFATFAERVWFLDIYPLSVRSSIKEYGLDPNGMHFQGMRRVEELIQKNGPQFFLEIPKIWQRL
jgi:hypothetical protein